MVSTLYKSFFDNRLYTIFSTGGKENPQTGYQDVEPAFAVIQNSHFFIENSYIYKIKINNDTIFLNLFNKQLFTENQVVNFKLEDEFACDSRTRDCVRNIFKTIQGNIPKEEQDV